MARDSFPETVEVTRRLPFGYDWSGDKTYGVANWEVLGYLSDAFDQLDNGDSYRAAVDTLKGKGQSLSIAGLYKLYQKWRPEQASKKSKSHGRTPKPKKPVLTAKEKKLRKKKYKIAAEKRRITNAQKRLEKLSEEKTEEQKSLDEANSYLNAPVMETPEHLTRIEKDTLDKHRDVVFEPNPGPQTDFLAAPEFEVLYGGAAGGGKSYALIADPIRYFDNPHFVGLMLRRTNDELRELIWKTKELYPKIYPDAKFSEKASEWRFPSGARLWMSYLDRDEDALRYVGQAYTWVGFDELSHWASPYGWNTLRSRVRAPSNSGLSDQLAMRATTNPGGPGHGWVKKMFIDPAPHGQAFWATDIDTGLPLKNERTGEHLFKRRFIPAMLSDNPYLFEDGIYERQLSSLPEKKRRQLLLGDWTVADGAAFEEFDASVHVVEPFELDKYWTRFRAMDYGYSSFSAVLWFAINPSNNQLVVYRELYVSKKTGEAIADTVNYLERGEKINYGMLDSSVWHKRGEGPSVAEVMIARGCRWRPADRSPGSRIAGKNRIHELLKVDEDTGQPGLVIFNTCRQLIADLPVIPSDPKGTDDIDPRFESDHTYDALRYGVMSRPRSDPYIDQPYQPTAPVVDRVFGY